jgi:hypothetical protein
MRIGKVLGLVLIVLAVGCSTAGRTARERVRSGQERIKAFSVDFNWGPGGVNGFAPPGAFVKADPAEHVRWYKELGANVIQTFAVNCCGYAWYPSAVAPVQPGLKRDFLGEMVRLGHREGMVVIGYFCVGANTYWGQTHPELSHGIPDKIHIPLTTTYLDYLCASIQDALRKTEMDGIILDWFYNASHPYERDKKVEWLACEKQMWTELMGEAFPGEDRLEKANVNEYHRRAVDRAWGRVRDAARAAKPDCIIWLTAFDVTLPEVADARILKEADWLMNESPKPEYLVAAKKMKGPKTKLIQCICGWGDSHDTNKFVTDPKFADVGLYGYNAADPATTLPATKSADPVLEANARNVEIIRQAYNKK